MRGMPKSTLSLEEVARLEYIIYLKYDLNQWQKGLEGQPLSVTSRNSFHQLGLLAMGAEGFNDLY